MLCELCERGLQKYKNERLWDISSPKNKNSRFLLPTYIFACSFLDTHNTRLRLNHRHWDRRHSIFFITWFHSIYIQLLLPSISETGRETSARLCHAFHSKAHWEKPSIKVVTQKKKHNTAYVMWSIKMPRIQSSIFYSWLYISDTVDASFIQFRSYFFFVQSSCDSISQFYGFLLTLSKWRVCTMHVMFYCAERHLICIHNEWSKKWDAPDILSCSVDIKSHCCKLQDCFNQQRAHHGGKKAST